MFVGLPKVLINIAKVLVVGGVLLLGFVGYQLWGTGIQHSRAQSALSNDFEKLEAEFVEVSENNELSAPNETDEILIDSIARRGDFEGNIKFRLTDSVVEKLPNLYRETGKAIARIANQRIGLNEIVVEGTEVDDLKKGPGHYATTPFPGQPGNVAIAGHRTTYGAPFANIQKLEVEDEIIVTTIQGTFIYKVMELGEDGEAFKIVHPDQNEELTYQGGNHLTLTSCHPRFSASERIIVRAELVDAPVVPLPRPNQATTTESFSSATAPVGVEVATTIGLSGDSSARLPVAILSIIFVALIAGVIFAKKKWGENKRFLKWIIYGTSCLPVLATIGGLYYFVDRMLPSF